MMNGEYCSNKNCDKSKDGEKRQKKEIRDQKKDEKINITYNNGNVGDSVLMKFINTDNKREYWSAFQRKPKYPDNWIEDTVAKHFNWLATDDRRVPQTMRDDYKSGDNFIHEEEVMPGNGAFDTANAALEGLRASGIAYHTNIKTPKNQDPIYDNLMQDDELMIPTASLKRLIRKTDEDFDSDDISIGDYVDFGAYGKLYVVSDDGERFRVTDKEKDRKNRNASGWGIRKSYAKDIIESIYDIEDKEEENYDGYCDECGQDYDKCTCDE